ncbi:cytochrome c nitrite reductase small subunit [Novipirellula artificiosorum]|uniref:Cytochrome c-type protein NrfH n=1 Tax=Novipirellula artificiosorum TaxID=2528016 RepID=A0A5C6DML7_9BACT|nr:cytochrome c nitrite reductase small subunit [Novipirellula artificiosorum]TWU37394.1 Cytochrome c-type protein NrfH [Novipirellula artificiosorum]
MTDSEPTPLPPTEADETGGDASGNKIRFGKAAVLFTVFLGILAGVGTFTFGYGKGASYLSNNPETCVNCHVMQEHMDSWQHSSHHHVAVCNDCHLPHHFLGKWVTKADNGFFHSLAFTLQNYRDPIQIKPRNQRVTQAACVDCHQDVVHAMLPVNAGEDMQSCVHCHSDVGHAFR